MTERPAAPERMAVAFAAVLREAGVPVPISRVVSYAEALAAVGLGSRHGAYWAGRATLLSAPDQTAAYDEAFDAFWSDRRVPAPASGVPTVEELAVSFDDEPSEEPDAEVAGDRHSKVVAARYSAREALRHKDFAAYSPEEHAEARRLMADL